MGILDPVRHKIITGSPEEVIRQKTLLLLTEKLGYPSQLIAVEKQLQHLIQNKNDFTKKIPNKRIDLMVFTPLSLQLNYVPPTNYPQPLLILEFKTYTLNKKALIQLIGYNSFLKAPCIGLANHKEILLGVLNLHTKKYDIIYNFLSFNDLTQLFCKPKNPHNFCDPLS